MPSNTPVLALPYPVPADTVDVPRDVQALATKLDGISAIAPPLVSALPGSPVDGQECYYVADATAGVVWHLRYRAASVNAYKWEFVGGSSLQAQVVSALQVVSGSWVQIEPHLNIPAVGEYLISYGGFFNIASAASTVTYYVGLFVTGTLDGNTAAAQTNPAGATNSSVWVPNLNRLLGVGSLYLGANVSQTSNINLRTLAVRPIRLQ